MDLAKKLAYYKEQNERKKIALREKKAEEKRKAEEKKKEQEKKKNASLDKKALVDKVDELESKLRDLEQEKARKSKKRAKLENRAKELAKEMFAQKSEEVKATLDEAERRVNTKVSNLKSTAKSYSNIDALSDEDFHRMDNDLKSLGDDAPTDDFDPYATDGMDENYGGDDGEESPVSVYEGNSSDVLSVEDHRSREQFRKNIIGIGNISASELLSRMTQEEVKKLSVRSLIDILKAMVQVMESPTFSTDFYGGASARPTMEKLRLRLEAEMYKLNK